MKTYKLDLVGHSGPVAVSVDIDEHDIGGDFVRLDMFGLDIENEQMMNFMTGQTSEPSLLWKIINYPEDIPDGYKDYDKTFEIIMGRRYPQLSDEFRTIVALMLSPYNRASAIGIMCSMEYRLAKRPSSHLLNILIDSLVQPDAIADLISRRDCDFPFDSFIENYKNIGEHQQERVIRSVRMSSYEISDWKAIADVSGDKSKFLLVLTMAKSPELFDFAYVKVGQSRVMQIALDIVETIESERMRADALVYILVHASGKPKTTERLGDMLLKLDQSILYEHRDSILLHNNVFPPRQAGKFLVMLQWR